MNECITNESLMLKKETFFFKAVKINVSWVCTGDFPECRTAGCVVEARWT